MQPRITIVTVCLNAERTIRRMLESVRPQRGTDWELVLIDGGSSDGTLDIIREYRDICSRLVSEPDSGIAHAMNKGIAASRGEYLLFLNADDFLLDATVLERASPYLARGADIVAGSVLLGAQRRRRLRPRGFGPWTLFKTPFLHQGAFIRRSLFERLGGYDEGIGIAMDYELFLRAYRAGVRALVLSDLVVAVMGDTGISSRRSWAVVRQRLSEEFQSQRKNMKSRVEMAWYLPWWAIYPVYKRLRLASPLSGRRRQQPIE